MKSRLICIFAFIPAGLAAQDTVTKSFDFRAQWNDYLQRTYDWQRISYVAVDTAFGQAFRLNRCGRPPYCFSDDFGRSLARRSTRMTIELGVGALLHEDIQRRPSGLTGFRRRFLYAMEHAPLAKGPEGDWRPAYSRFAGTFGGIAVSSTWQGRPLTAERMFEGFGWSATSYFQDALLTEFEPDLKHFGARLVSRFRVHHTPGNLATQ